MFTRSVMAISRVFGFNRFRVVDDNQGRDSFLELLPMRDSLLTGVAFKLTCTAVVTVIQSLYLHQN